MDSVQSINVSYYCSSRYIEIVVYTRVLETGLVYYYVSQFLRYL